MIAVTGATGNVGSALLSTLVADGTPVRALSRSAQPETPGVEWVQVAAGDVDALTAAFAGVDKVALITAANEDMAAQEAAVVEAAAAAGVTHVVKLSGLGAGPDAPIRLPQQHYATEEAIKAAGLGYTFVRPNLFMQNLLGDAGSIASDGVVYAPSGDGAISFTDLRDVVAVMATALLEPGHEAAVHEMTGPQALTYAEAAKVLGSVIDRDVEHVDVSPDTARAAMLDGGLSPWVAEAFVELYGIYRAGYGASVLADTVETVTGAPARSLEEFAQDHRTAFLP